MKEVPVNEGQIHDISWAPDGKQFMVITGYMPSLTVVYDDTCKPLFDMGKIHRNTIRWSPLGRFCIIAGFGNLNGEIDIWDMREQKKIAKCKSPSAASCIWSPDGRKFLTAVLTPRLRVENEFSIYYYDGTLL
jgi:translation initiation factor 2A